MATIFSNTSVAPSDPPRHLWTQADEDLLQQRLGYADCVAIGTTKGVSVYSTLGSPKQLALALHPQVVIHGSLEPYLDKDGDLMLQLTPSTDDFQLAVQLQKNIPGTQYLVFLKKQPSSSATPIWHWAFYRNEPRLLQEIRAVYSHLQQTTNKK